MFRPLNLYTRSPVDRAINVISNALAGLRRSQQHFARHYGLDAAQTKLLKDAIITAEEDLAWLHHAPENDLAIELLGMYYPDEDDDRLLLQAYMDRLMPAELVIDAAA